MSFRKAFSTTRQAWCGYRGARTGAYGSRPCMYRIDISDAETQPFGLYVLGGRQVATAHHFCPSHNWFTGVQRIWGGCTVPSPSSLHHDAAPIGGSYLRMYSSILCFRSLTWLCTAFETCYTRCLMVPIALFTACEQHFSGAFCIYTLAKKKRKEGVWTSNADDTRRALQYTSV